MPQLEFHALLLQPFWPAVMPQLDPHAWPPQLFWLAVTFIALYVLISRVVIPRTGGGIEARRSTVESNLNDAQAMKDKADAAVKAYEARLADARASADAIAKENYAALAAEMTAERSKLDASLMALISDAERRVHDAKAKAMAEAKTLAADIASAIVGELTGARVADSAVTDAIAELER
jgi:F-type H+-transporting ATPase subunit b